MLKNLLNLLPAPLVRKLGDSSFESLENRGEIKTWMVATEKPNDGDGDDDLVEFNFDDFDFDDNAAQESPGIEPDYIKRHIQRIPHYGDDSRYRLASHLDMFEHLNPNGTLTPEQRQAVDNFAAGYQSNDYRSELDCDTPDSGWESSFEEDYRYEFDDDCREVRDACTHPCDADCALPCDDDSEMDFPECQYVANGLDLETAQKLGDTYRAGDIVESIGHEATDRISSRLNKMQSRRTTLEK